LKKTDKGKKTSGYYRNRRWKMRNTRFNAIFELPPVDSN